MVLPILYHDKKLSNKFRLTGQCVKKRFVFAHLRFMGYCQKIKSSRRGYPTNEKSSYIPC